MSADRGRGAAFTVHKLIRFHHCDPAGIVFYPQYFVLFNEVVEDWFNGALGIDFAAFHAEQRLGIPMARIECEFLAPTRAGETLAFSLTVINIGRSSVTLGLSASGPEHAIRVQARLTVVQASLDTRRAVHLNAELKERMQRFVLDAPPGASD